MLHRTKVPELNSQINKYTSLVVDLNTFFLINKSSWASGMAQVVECLPSSEFKPQYHHHQKKKKTNKSSKQEVGNYN
jgi:hypothetical protein